MQRTGRQAYDLICQFKRQRLKCTLLTSWPKPKKARQLAGFWPTVVAVSLDRSKRQFPCQQQQWQQPACLAYTLSY